MSKIIRFDQKDIDDMDILIQRSDKALILQIIAEVLSRTDLYETKKIGFTQKLILFKERYNV